MNQPVDDLVVTDSERLDALYVQTRDVKRLLAILVLMALAWSFWFVMNRADERAQANAEDRIECMDTGRNC